MFWLDRALTLGEAQILLDRLVLVRDLAVICPTIVALLKKEIVFHQQNIEDSR